MTQDDLTEEKRKQLIEFYKAIKVASKLMPRNHQTNMAVQLADQIIIEFKKENPDKNRIQELSDKLQGLSSVPTAKK